MTSPQPARVSPANVSGASGTDKQLFGMPTLYLGHSATETTGTASAEVDIYDGTDDTGMPLFKITLLANESARDFVPEPFIHAGAGVYAKITSGSVNLTVYGIIGV